MCTLTLVAENDGYLLAMNRDERIARGAGTKPATDDFNGTRVLYPTDGVGGTWIGANEHGIALALLNWNDPVPQPVRNERSESRGRVIPALIDSGSMAEVLTGIPVLDLDRMLPFRLVGIFPREQGIREWKWDSHVLDVLTLPWESQHWFSSGLSDEQARRLRGATCRDAWTQPGAGSSAWLRELHASHADGPVAFSMCVHREEVQTLSFTEIRCTPEKVKMEHFFGNPCILREGHSAEVDRASSGDSVTLLAQRSSAVLS